MFGPINQAQTYQFPVSNKKQTKRSTVGTQKPSLRYEPRSEATLSGWQDVSIQLLTYSDGPCRQAQLSGFCTCFCRSLGRVSEKRDPICCRRVLTDLRLPPACLSGGQSDGVCLALWNSNTRRVCARLAFPAASISRADSAWLQWQK